MTFTHGDRPLRVLLIAGCFPHPDNERLGVWALSQAEAVAEQGIEMEVISPTSYLPRILGKLGMAPWAALCPPKARMGSLWVLFPRWPVYHAMFGRSLNKRWPGFALALGWRFVRRALRDAIARRRPDVIFAHHSFEGGELARRLKQETGINYVISDWDFDEITDCERFAFRRQHYERVLRSASAVVATSGRMKRDLDRLFPGTRVVVAHYGRDPIPAGNFESPRPADRQGKIIIFCACGFYRRKGLVVLLEAFSRVQKKYPGCELWIAGDGPDRAEVEAGVRDFGGGHVRLLGGLSHEQVLQEMVWADIFALTGWDEPFATVYVEALAAGKPIVCCDDGGICDVVTHGKEALLVPPRDVAATAQALDSLVGDPAMRGRMSQASSQLFYAKLSRSVYGQTVAHELAAAARPSLTL